MRRSSAFLVALLACTGCSTEDATDAEKASISRVSVGAISNVTLRAGESTMVAIPVVVADGYHVQSHPAANEFLVPLEVKIESGEDVIIGSPAYPSAHIYRLTGTEEDLLTYKGTVLIEISVAVPPSVSPGDRTVSGTVRYQACDSRMCFAPASIPVEFTVVVSD